MKIGEFAKKYNLPISSVRHYINIGILMPERSGKQFNFRKSDHETMDMLNTLKAGGFSLKETNVYINTLRNYDPNDNSKYIRLISLLRKKELSLLSQKEELDNSLQFVSKLIAEYTEKYKLEETTGSNGIHIDFLDYLVCPKCGNSLQLENASIHSTQIFSGILYCSCGYTTHINDGLLFTDIEQDLDKDSDFFDDYFGEDKDAEYDTPFFESTNNASPEYLTIQYKTREWMHTFVKEKDLRNKLVLFPDVSFQFLYLYHDTHYFDDSLIILTVLSKKGADKLRTHLHKLNSRLKVAIIVSPDCNLPLKDSCIDLVIDYLGSYSYSFYKNAPYISYIAQYLSEKASIIGAIDYFDRNSGSLKLINSSYKSSVCPFPDHKQYKKALSQENFTVSQEELIGTCKLSGSYFEYHINEDTRYSYAYCAERKDRRF